MNRKHKRQHPFYDSAAWRTLRQRIVARDGYACTVCHIPLGKGETRVDHIVPMKQAPHLALVASNLRTLCARCDAVRHREKGGKAKGYDRPFDRGCDVQGLPRDPQNHWYKARGGE